MAFSQLTSFIEIDNFQKDIFGEESHPSSQKVSDKNDYSLVEFELFPKSNGKL